MMFTSSPSLMLTLLLTVPGLLATAASQEPQLGRHTSQDSIRVVVSEGCATQGDSSAASQGGRELSLAAGSPLVLTHNIKLVPLASGSGTGSCGCETEFAGLRERVERLEREVSTLREKCGGPDGGCCTSKESKGAGCSIKSGDECPNDCSDQGRCVDGSCVCFPGYSGSDCGKTDCPGNCDTNGRCVGGRCLCDPGFTGPDCSQRSCPDDCSRRGSCFNGGCVCSSGFTGPSCSEESCPGNCSSRGRCVGGRCLCSPGFTGLDCSDRACPDSCSDHGHCVNGRCVCEGGFAGDDCSERSCPGNCSSRGRCAGGQCICDGGFAGADCSERACPNSCSDRGRCVGGACVCSVGFTGADCSSKSCPGNCTSRGRCVRGRCVCRRGFAGPDCSLCEDGKTGPDCDTGMSGVSQLSTRGITETSATLVWTPPAVQYDSYSVTFTSQKERDQQVTVQVDGSLTTFTQTGLAAGQEYSVTVTGEIGGRRGAESSAEFMTLIPSPSNLQVVKTSTTSAVVQWDKSQGEIDRYRLTVTPRDGAETPQEVTVPVSQNSAHILHLEAGRLYDIVLVAEKGTGRSAPASTQAVPGSFTSSALNVQVTLSPGQEAGSTNQDFNPSTKVQVPDPHGGKEDKDEAGFGKVSRQMTRDGTQHGPSERPTLLKKPNVPGRSHFSATRAVPKVRKFGSHPLTKPPRVDRVGPKPISGHETRSSTVSDPSVEASRSERMDDRSPAGTVSEPYTDVPEPPGQENAAPVSAGAAGPIHSQEQRCLNKTKVTHTSLALKARGGCRTFGSSELEALPLIESDADSTPDPLHKLLSDTFNSLNISTFSVHLSKPSDLSVDAETVRKQILTGLKPLSSFSPSSRLARPSRPQSPLALASRSQGETSSTVAPTSADSPSLPSSAPLPPPSSSAPLLSSSTSHVVKSDSIGLSRQDDNHKSPTTVGLPANRKSLPSRGRASQFRQRGHVRHPLSESGTLQNKTRLNRIPPRLNVTGHASSPASPASKGSSLVEMSAPVEAVAEDRMATAVSHQSQKQILEERKRIPVRPFPPKRGYMRRPFPNTGSLQNQTRFLTDPSKPLHPKEQVPSTALPTTFSPSVSQGSYSAGGTKPVVRETQDGYGTKLSSDFSQNLGGRGRPSSHHPTTRVGYFQHLQRHGGSSGNKTRQNPRQPLHRDPRRKLPPTKMNKLPIGFKSVNSRGQDLLRSTKEVRDKETESYDPTIRPYTQPTSSEEEETSNLDTNIREQRPEGHHAAGRPKSQGRATNKPSFSDSGTMTATVVPKEAPPTHTQVKHHSSGSQRKEGPKTGHGARRSFNSRTGPTRGSVSNHVRRPGVSAAEAEREPLDYVGVRNPTSDGFTLIWDSPEGKYKNFVVTTKEAANDKEPKLQTGKPDFDGQEAGTQPARGSGDQSEDDNRLPSGVGPRGPGKPSSTDGRDGAQTKVLPGSSRSLQAEALLPQTQYTVTLLGTAPGLLSRLHKLVISTGPEPPSNVVFSKVTDDSVTVSWTKPKSRVDGFKVTYAHRDDGDPLSVSVASDDSTLGLSQLSPGSSYEVSVISLLGLDESDAVRDVVTTLPDPPTDVQAVNVTDTSALLLWRPALAAVDTYSIVYGSGTGSEVRVSVSANAAEQQLSGLDDSTTYTVTISSQQGSVGSPPATTTFTTTRGSGGEGDVPRDLQANNVTPRAALLSWKPPTKPVGSYRLTFQTEGQEMKEVTVDASGSGYSLTRLHPGSQYTVQLQAERGGRYLSVISTEFSTDHLRFPFPTDCSQELLNGIQTSGRVEIFPQGKPGTPLEVYCDMETDGGGWTVFQRRKDGSVNFFRGWKDYSKGFGDLNGEFWLGLENLHNLTAVTRMILRVDLRDRDEAAFAKYSTFGVAKKNFRLSVGGYSGTAGDSLSYHNNRIFSTKDRDPAQFITRCAMSYRGGWWYKNCHEANLNGLYGINVKHQGVIWTAWKGKDFSIPFTEMKMRPAAFSPPSRG